MDVSLHETLEGAENHPVPLQRALAGKVRGYNSNAEMALSFSGAWMADMAMALVDDLQLIRRKRPFQAAPYFRDSIGPVHG
jgi:hypothetical protein